MRTWYFADNEPVLDDNGDIKIIEDIDSLVENIDQRFQLFQNKYFMDLLAGIPYLEDIITKPVDPGLAASIFNAEILKESEVTEIGEVSVSLDRDTRQFQYNATIYSVFGELEVSN